MILVWLSPDGELLTATDMHLQSDYGTFAGTWFCEIVTTSLLSSGFECLGEL